MHIRQAYLILGVAAVILLIIAYLILAHASLPIGLSQPARDPNTPPPPPSDFSATVLKQSKGFAALVSYTDSGFEPQSVTIKKGETVRFTNNSQKTLLWVAGTSTAAGYPGTSACGGSSFDTCQTMQSGDFWEFTFDQAGEWHYHNNSDPTQTGVVIVE
jgi:plastocyanin